jgi:hypothetical protein
MISRKVVDEVIHYNGKVIQKQLWERLDSNGLLEMEMVRKSA